MKLSLWFDIPICSEWVTKFAEGLQLHDLHGLICSLCSYESRPNGGFSVFYTLPENGAAKTEDTTSDRLAKLIREVKKSVVAQSKDKRRTDNSDATGADGGDEDDNDDDNRDEGVNTGEEDNEVEAGICISTVATPTPPPKKKGNPA